MTTPTPAVAFRVTRDDLARHPWTWRTTGLMTAFLAVAALAVTFVNRDVPALRLDLLALTFALIGAHLLLSEPPAIHTLRNHLVVALPAVGAAALAWCSQTGGGLAVGAAMFIGPLASIRLDRRAHLTAHLLVASLLFLLVGVAGGVDTPTKLCLLISGMAMWILGFSCWTVLDMAEAQGRELERLVRRDPLTGIGNLRLLREQLGEELARHARLGRPLTLLTLDLNGFKGLNDQLGHAEGDLLLQRIAEGLTAVVGPGDTVARQGGDEFCILLPETSAALAVRTINAVRATVAQAGVEGVTTGVGMATYPDDADRAEVLLHVADERLRADKATSRPPTPAAERERPPGEGAAGNA